MKKRTFGHRQFPVIEQRIRLSEVSRDTTLQCRQDDSPWIRGRDIAKSMRDTGAPRFRDNIVVAKRHGEYIIVDGFGRYEAANELTWQEIDVDVLGSRTKDDDLLFIALTANNGQVSERAFTANELQESAYMLHTKLGLSYEEIAEVQDVETETVKRRVIRGQQICEARAKDNSLTALQVFAGMPAAKSGALKVLNSALKLRCETYTDLCKTIRDQFDIELRLFVGGNEKQVKGLVYELLANEQERKPTNFLVLFYLQKVGDNTDSAWRMANRIKALKRIQGLGSFHFADLSADTACFNGRDVACFVQGCRRAAKEVA